VDLKLVDCIESRAERFGGGDVSRGGCVAQSSGDVNRHANEAIAVWQDVTLVHTDPEFDRWFGSEFGRLRIVLHLGCSPRCIICGRKDCSDAIAHVAEDSASVGRHGVTHQSVQAPSNVEHCFIADLRQQARGVDLIDEQQRLRLHNNSFQCDEGR